MRQLYWCDRCYKEIVDENDETKRIYFSCYSNQQWASHLKSKKHLKICKEVEQAEQTQDSDNILCKYCNKNFTKEGYEIHSKRNNKLWELQNRGGYKNLKCNNFFTNTKRYETLEDYLEGVDPNRPKLKRTKVGKYSPITCSVREPNKNNKTKAQTKKDYENDLEYCKSCNNILINDSNYTDKQLKDYFNKDMCECLEGEAQEQELEWESKHDGLKLTIEEIDYTEKPKFYDYCGDCGCGLIEEGLTKNIYITWEMDYCDCETDSSDSDQD